MSVGCSLRTRVKICGITRLVDAEEAVNCGADALGFIFYRKSPRFITPEMAKEIIGRLPPFVDRVGVFVNGHQDELVSAAAAGLSCLQLHGSESPGYCHELREKLPFYSVIKAFRVGENSSTDQFTPYNECADAFLLDTYVEGTEGGTGRTFDWSIIERLQLRRPVLLAGGLTPENIVQAIERVTPFGVDVNSGIETRPGVKDHRKLLRLMMRVASCARR